MWSFIVIFVLGNHMREVTEKCQYVCQRDGHANALAHALVTANALANALDIANALANGLVIANALANSCFPKRWTV